MQRSEWERIRRGELLLHCGVLGGAKHFGAHRGRQGVGHIVAAARLQLVFIAPTSDKNRALQIAKKNILLNFNVLPLSFLNSSYVTDRQTDGRTN